jgi:hypothetical protein
MKIFITIYKNTFIYILFIKYINYKQIIFLQKKYTQLYLLRILMY